MVLWRKSRGVSQELGVGKSGAVSQLDGRALWSNTLCLQTLSAGSEVNELPLQGSGRVAFPRCPSTTSVVQNRLSCALGLFKPSSALGCKCAFWARFVLWQNSGFVRQWGGHKIVLCLQDQVNVALIILVLACVTLLLY